MRHHNDARPQSSRQQSGPSGMELKRVRLRLRAEASSRCRQVAQVRRGEKEEPQPRESFGENKREKHETGQGQFSLIESLGGTEGKVEEEDCSGLESEPELLGHERKKRKLSSSTTTTSDSYSEAENLFHEHEMATAMAASLQTSLQTTTTTADDDEVEVDSISRRPISQQQQPQHHHHLHQIEGPLSETELDRLSELVKIIRQGSYSELLGLLESQQGSKNLLNVFYHGYTALHYSLMSHRGPDWCKQLIMNGANPNLSTFNGWHSIHLAAFCAPPATLCYLVEYFDDFTVNQT